LEPTSKRTWQLIEIQKLSLFRNFLFGDGLVSDRLNALDTNTGSALYAPGVF